MADFPTTTELFAFAIAFVPGYLSLNVGSFLVKGKTFGLPWVEKVLLSYVWSLLIFLTLSALLQTPLTVTTVQDSLTTGSALLLLTLSVLFGLASALLYYVSFRLLDRVTWLADKLAAKTGAGADYYFESTAVRFLKGLWENRDKHELVVETQSGRIFKGALGSKSFEPTMDILLTKPSKETTGPPKETVRLAMLELVDGEWVEMDEWSMLVPQQSLRTVGAVKAREIEL